MFYWDVKGFHGDVLGFNGDFNGLYLDVIAFSGISW